MTVEQLVTKLTTTKAQVNQTLENLQKKLDIYLKFYCSEEIDYGDNTSDSILFDLIRLTQELSILERHIKENVLTNLEAKCFPPKKIGETK